MMEQIFKRFCCQKNTTATGNISAVASACLAFSPMGIFAVAAMLIFKIQQIHPRN
jgi:hypothetical protein